jgi:hypothetical protein
MTDRGLFLTRQAIRRQVAAMPCELYVVRLIHCHTRRAFPGERLWTAAELTHGATVRFLRIRNCEGCDVYLQPFAADCNPGYILLDLDHANPAVLDTMRANGHEPCVVLQTSPGNLQAWVRVSPAPLEPAVATAIARQLAHTYGADLSSADGRHLGRLAGFTNQKPGRRLLSGRAPWVRVVHTMAGFARNARALLRTATPLPVPAPVRMQGQGVVPVPITGVQALEIYQHWMQRWRILERYAPPDWSIVDLWIARELLAQGRPAAEVEDVLRLGSPQFPRRHGNPEDYLRRTLARAAFPAPERAVSAAHARASAPAGTNSACSNSTGGR